MGGYDLQQNHTFIVFFTVNSLPVFSVSIKTTPLGQLRYTSYQC